MEKSQKEASRICSCLIYRAQRELPNLKHQILNADFIEHPRRSRDNIKALLTKIQKGLVLEFGILNLFGLWVLEFGI
jgi:hypothetical protein